MTRQPGSSVAARGLLALVGALIAAVFVLAMTPNLAHAQDDSGSDTADYPGPFDTDGSDTANDSTDTSPSDTAPADAGTDDAETDEVLGASVVRTTGDGLGDAFVAPDISPSTATTDAATASGGSGLAATGSSVEPIIAISVGMLAVGGSALVSSRRSLRDLFR